MILYQKQTDKNNILGFEYIYEDKNNYVFIDYDTFTEYKASMIQIITIQEKSSSGFIDTNDVIDILDSCYEIVHYGKLKFHKGQLDIY
tara:strand:- start:312 stop:575 length:264 start_codon:yes stop_codon:yes gene_type:complete